MTIHGLLAQVAVVMAGVTALYVFFQALKSDWPHTYFSVSDTISQRISASPWHYLGFRVVPVFAVCFFVAGSLANAGAEYRVAPFAIAIIQTAATNGRALGQWVKRGTRAFGFWSATTGHTLAFVGSIAAAAASVLTADRQWTRLLLPSVAEISASLWTAVIAAILGAFIVRAASRPAGDLTTLAERGMQDIEPGLWQYARSVAEQNDVDTDLFLAILVAENLQRPGWIRALEQVRHTLGFTGTYGIMQAYGAPPIDDRRSIDLAAIPLRGARPPEDYEYGWARPFIALHNPDPGFVEMAHEMQYVIDFVQQRRFG